MGRAGRGGGGLRGGGRMGGGLGGRSGSGRIGGGGALGGRAGQGLGGVGRAPRPAPPRPAARPVAPRRNAGFAAGVAVGSGMRGPRRRHGWGGGWGRGPRWGWGGRRRHNTVIINNGHGGMHRGGGGGGGNGCGCVAMLVMLLIFGAIVLLISMQFNAGFIPPRMQPITRSTVERTALPRGYANDNVPFFTDNMSPAWIGNPARLENGMRNFYNATGVRPHLYLTSEINGSAAVPTLAQLNQFAEATYNRIFDDEAHVLLIFFENAQGQYAMYVMPGGQARLLMDDEAREIMMDYVQRYYYSRYDTEDMFARVFNGTSARIMRTEPNNMRTAIFVLGGVLVVLILFTWWKRKQEAKVFEAEQRQLEAEETERILSQSLDTFGTAGNDAASTLAQQYTDEATNNTDGGTEN